MKKAIVIGATSGIGKETAEKLAENGYEVELAGRREERLIELKRWRILAWLINILPEGFRVK